MKNVVPFLPKNRTGRITSKITSQKVLGKWLSQKCRVAADYYNCKNTKTTRSARPLQNTIIGATTHLHSGS